MLDEVLRALRTHRGPEVAAAARETLVGDFSARVTGEWEHLAGLLVKNLEHVGMKRIVELAVDERPHVRKAAALVLGWSASADAVAPLLRLLGDGKAAVRNQAHDALTRLGGERPDPRERETRTAEEWASTFGKNGERLDPERSRRHEDPEPGVYRIGR